MEPGLSGTAKLLIQSRLSGYIAFLGQENTFDHAPHEHIWYALRKYSALEKLLYWAKLVYLDLKSKVMSVVSISKQVRMSAGVHQRSVIPPLLLSGTATWDIKFPVPCTALYADNDCLAFLANLISSNSFKNRMITSCNTISD